MVLSMALPPLNPGTNNTRLVRANDPTSEAPEFIDLNDFLRTEPCPVNITPTWKDFKDTCKTNMNRVLIWFRDWIAKKAGL